MIRKYIDSEQLKYLIRSNGLSIAEFSNKIGKSRGYFLNMLQHGIPFGSALHSLCKKALNCTDDDLESDSYINELRVVSQNLKKRRVMAGYTQKQLCAKTGISLSTYCSYETGRHRASVESLNLLCSALGMTVTELYKEEDTPLTVISYIELRMQMLNTRLSSTTKDEKRQELLYRINELKRMLTEITEEEIVDVGQKTSKRIHHKKVSA